MHLLVVFEY